MRKSSNRSICFSTASSAFAQYQPRARPQKITMSTTTTMPQSDHQADFRRRLIETFDPHVSSKQDKLDQLVSIRSFALRFIKDASHKAPLESEAVKQGLSVLWHMFLETAKFADRDDAFQDQLVSMLLWTREIDLLHKRVHPTKTSTVAWESYGFDNSLQSKWEELMETVDATQQQQQQNLATFSAKALAVGVHQDSIGLTALWYLRETFETEDSTRAIALLPAAVTWLENCNFKLFTLSVTENSFEDDSKYHLVEPGVLAKGAGIDRPAFSLQRWLFWRRRLQELNHSANEEVAKEAHKGFMAMINCGRKFDYDVPGEAKFTEKLQAAMWEELVRSGKKSVDGHEIDINVDWAD